MISEVVPFEVELELWWVVLRVGHDQLLVAPPQVLVVWLAVGRNLLVVISEVVHWTATSLQHLVTVGGSSKVVLLAVPNGVAAL